MLLTQPFHSSSTHGFMYQEQSPHRRRRNEQRYFACLGESPRHAMLRWVHAILLCTCVLSVLLRPTQNEPPQDATARITTTTEAVRGERPAALQGIDEESHSHSLLDDLRCKVPPAEGGTPRRGVYFLANHAVYEETAAFLASLRHFHAPDDLLVYWIPYGNDELMLNTTTTATDAPPRRFLRLLRHYHVCLWDNDPALLHRIDTTIQRAYDESTKFHYRKLALWSGPLDEFLYLDVDSVIVAPIELDRLCDVLLPRYGVVTGHADFAGATGEVWRTDPPVSLLNDDNSQQQRQIHYSANTGMILSTKRFATTEAWMARAMAVAPMLRPHLYLPAFEQPLLNFLFVTTSYNSTMSPPHPVGPYPYDSLLRLAYPDVYPLFPGEESHLWMTSGEPRRLLPVVVSGNDPDLQITVGNDSKGIRVLDPKGWPAFQLHWAGYDSPHTYSYAALWKHWRQQATVAGATA